MRLLGVWLSSWRNSLLIRTSGSTSTRRQLNISIWFTKVQSNFLLKMDIHLRSTKTVTCLERLTHFVESGEMVPPLQFHTANFIEPQRVLLMKSWITFLKSNERLSSKPLRSKKFWRIIGSNCYSETQYMEWKTAKNKPWTISKVWQTK